MMDESPRSHRVRMLVAPAAALLFALAASDIGTASAQVVSGRLLDEQTGEPIAGAAVLLLDRSVRAVTRDLTDSDGVFRLRAPVTGRYRIHANRLGYKQTSSPPIDVLEREGIEVELRLSAVAIPLAPLTVVSDRPALVRSARLVQGGFYERRAEFGRDGLRSGRFLDRAEIVRLNPALPTDVLREIPGVWVRPVGAFGPGSRILTMRRGCKPSIYLNGVPLRRLSVDDILSASSLVGVEIYSGRPYPARFTEFETANILYCGVIVLWTGSS